MEKPGARVADRRHRVSRSGGDLGKGGRGKKNLDRRSVSCKDGPRTPTHRPSRVPENAGGSPIIDRCCTYSHATPPAWRIRHAGRIWASSSTIRISLTPPSAAGVDLHDVDGFAHDQLLENDAVLAHFAGGDLDGRHALADAPVAFHVVGAGRFLDEPGLGEGKLAHPVDGLADFPYLIGVDQSACDHGVDQRRRWAICMAPLSGPIRSWLVGSDIAPEAAHVRADPIQVLGRRPGAAWLRWRRQQFRCAADGEGQSVAFETGLPRFEESHRRGVVGSCSSRYEPSRCMRMMARLDWAPPCIQNERHPGPSVCRFCTMPSSSNAAQRAEHRPWPPSSDTPPMTAAAKTVKIMPLP
ncbi:hypothetical protein FQR65_LT20128 [Abscondita terminalis]|nr:hypothetical protein FQR65_LT20128 [Abscondita terminalis]